MSPVCCSLRHMFSASTRRCDPDRITSYVQIRGRVVSSTTEGAREQLDELSMKYLGRPYPGFGRGPGVRVLLTIEADRVIAQGR